MVVFLIFIGSGSNTSTVMISLSPSSNWAIATVCTCCRNSFWVSFPLINISALKRNPSTRPSGQLISGLKVANHGYPKMNWSPPRFVTKNLVLSCFLSRDTNRSQQCVTIMARKHLFSFFHLTTSRQLRTVLPTQPCQCHPDSLLVYLLRSYCIYRARFTSIVSYG